MRLFSKRSRADGAVESSEADLEAPPPYSSHEPATSDEQSTSNYELMRPKVFDEHPLAHRVYTVLSIAAGVAPDKTSKSFQLMSYVLSYFRWIAMIVSPMTAFVWQWHGGSERFSSFDASLPKIGQAALTFLAFYCTAVVQDLVCARAPPRQKILQSYELQSANVVLKVR